MPFSDGGEGALGVLEDHALGTFFNCDAHDALGNFIKASYFVFKNENTKIIEIYLFATIIS